MSAFETTKYGAINVEDSDGPPRITKGSKFAPWTVFGSVFLATLTCAITAAVVVSMNDKEVFTDPLPKWTLMQGDSIMRDTFLGLAATLMAERALSSEAFEGEAGDEDYSHKMRDAVLVCYKQDICRLYGGTCTHFQENCQATATSEDTCEESQLKVDNTEMCPLNDWIALAKTAKDPEVDFMVSYHWVARAMSRKQPGMNAPDYLQHEKKFGELKYKNATSRLSRGMPEYVIMNGCHESFLPSASYAWSSDNHLKLMKIYSDMVENNLRIYRTNGFRGPIHYQSCTPLSCDYLERKYDTTSDAQTGEYVYDCLGQNFQLRQVNKQLQKMFSERQTEVGDVRMVDAFTLMSVAPQETCDGISPFCSDVKVMSIASGSHPIGQGLGTLLSLKGVHRHDKQPSSMAPSLAKMTTESANPSVLQASVSMCPCTLEMYGQPDGSMPSNYFI